MLGKSFIEFRRRSGPRTEPCGKPDTTEVKIEAQLLAITNRRRSWRKLPIQVMARAFKFSL